MATFLAIVRQMLMGLYIILHCVFVSSCIIIWLLGLNYIICQINITLTQASPRWDPAEPFIVTDVCIHNPQNINNWDCIKQKTHNCMMSLLHLKAKTYRSWYLTHWGRVTQICVFTLQLRKTDDANLRF